MKVVKKETIQKPVEVSIAEQVLEETNDGRPHQDVMLIAGHGDRGIKFLHLQANQNQRSKVQAFCSAVEDSRHEVLVVSRSLMEQIISGEVCVHDPADH